MEKHFSIRESLAFGVSTFRKRPWFFVGITVISILFNYGFSYVSELFTSIFLSNASDTVISVVEGISSMATFFFTLLIQLAMTRMYLDSVDGKSPEVGEIFHARGLYLQNLFLTIISSAFIFVGFIFFIIPGVILSIILQFSIMSLIEENAGFMQAMRRSRELTKGVRVKLLVFNIISGLIMIAGVLCLGVGILVALPVVTLAHVFIYRQLRSQTTQ